MGMIDIWQNKYGYMKKKIKFDLKMRYINQLTQSTKFTNNLVFFASSEIDTNKIQRFPSTFERMIAAAIYVIPSLDAASLTLSLLKWWTSFSWAWFLIESISKLYFCHAVTPLIVFLIILLAIVRNKNFHHVVRFHTMQSILINMVMNLYQVVRSNLPPELRWSVLMIVCDRFFGATILITMAYCVWHAIQGQYADVAYISDQVYIQVDMLESYGAV